MFTKRSPKYSSLGYGSRNHRNLFKPGSSTYRYIWLRDKGLCVYCDEPATEIDHIIPSRLGGRGIATNGVCACRKCNMYRVSRPDDLDYLMRAYHHVVLSGEDVTTDLNY